MPKLKINIIDGKPTTPGVSIGHRRYDREGKELADGDQGPTNEKGNYYPVKIVTTVLVPDMPGSTRGNNPNIELVTTADVSDIGPFQNLVDRGILTTVAGRPKAAPSA